MDLDRIGVIGAGVMGAGVAQNLAQSGFEVVLIDHSHVLENVRQRIRQNIQGARLFKRKEEGEDTETLLRRIVTTTEYEALSDVDFIIENVTEKWEVKKKAYQRIDQICSRDVVFAANTSAISITRIGSATSRPSKILGIHFMNPVPMKGTAEVIKGYHTSEETLEVARHLLERMGKQYVVVNDSPGFVTNRVLMLTINEAVFLLQERVAAAEDIDRLFRECFGHKMGPLETADLIGLDTILFSIEVLHESFNDDKYRPCPLLKKMVDAGLHGRKSGSGFYKYL